MTGQAVLLLTEYASYMTGGEYFVDGYVLNVSPYYYFSYKCMTGDNSSGNVLENVSISPVTVEQFNSSTYP
jgi:hypothetical protein